MDFYEIMLQQKLAGGGGGGEDVSVKSLNVTKNGTYTALTGQAYSPVNVDVPNTYEESDEGKVVDNGSLVSQTSKNINANGTVDTTLNNSVVVNVPSVTPTGNINITSTAQTDVSAYATAQVVDADLVASNIKKDVDILGVVGTYEGGGGGGSSYTLLHEEDIEINTSSTTSTEIKTITVAGSYTSDDIIYVRAYDKAGARNGYLCRTETFCINPMPANSQTSIFQAYRAIPLYYNDGKYATGTNAYGVFPQDIKSDGTITISARYSASYTKTINGTFHIEVYKLAFPNNESPFV